MKGVWVKRDYGRNFHSRRHFFVDDGWVKENVPESSKGSLGGRVYPWYDYVHRMTGKSLCGRVQKYGGKDITLAVFPGNTTRTFTKGGLSIRKRVKLNQRNLCWHCLVKYMKEESKDIQKAFALLSKLR